VQGVLAMELVWAIVYYWTVKNQYLSTDLSILLPLAFCLLLIFTAWYLLKPILISAKAAPGYIAAYKRILYNPDIFNSLLQQQASTPDGWQKIGIDIGNPNATITILKVCNPYCGPCAKAHPVLEKIIKKNSMIKVKVIFTSTNNENDKANKPVKHLLAIAAKENLVLTALALDDWYLADKKDYEIFAAKYPLNGELAEQEWKIEMMSKWCNDAEIIGTPTFFINGKRLPESYNISELENIF
jgi:protein-disulfide isomerase